MAYTAAVITVSDKGFRGEREDTSGPAIAAMLKEQGMEVVRRAIVPDESELIQAELINCADDLDIDLIITTGGTGFSPRDITPEATLAVVERRTPGIPEAMRAESLRITPRGCLSRSEAGIRGGSLIINLPGSEKAAKENLMAVLPALDHGLKMLQSAGSADCAAAPAPAARPSIDEWIREAKALPDAPKIGMYLTHNGVVRKTSRSLVREGIENAPDVKGMEFGYDPVKVEEAVNRTGDMQGIYHVRTWLNQGHLKVGDDLMLVLIGADTRPHAVDALQFLVGELKNKCVYEKEE